MSYRYPGGTESALKSVSLEVHAGEFVLLTGPTGCGKSTLLRMAAGLSQRHGGGDYSGDVAILGLNPASQPPSERVRSLGFVSQNPQDQLVAGSIGDEVAFALESAGADHDEISKRVHEALEIVGLNLPLDHKSSALSGGQTQRLVVAGAIAASPPLLILDEPLSQLDPMASDRLLLVLKRLSESGTTILMVEHRLSQASKLIDRVVVMKDGEIAGEGFELVNELYGAPQKPSISPENLVAKGELIFSGESLSYKWPDADKEALCPMDITVCRGERIAVIGHNGSGKSTLLMGIAGHLNIGVSRADGQIIDVPQNPDLALFCETTELELAYGPTERRVDAKETMKQVTQASAALNIDSLLERAPQSLSKGQRLRAAVAAALTTQPDLLLLDEPTSGQDRVEVVRMMKGLCARGDDTAFIFATHDLGLAETFATRVIELKEGKVIYDGSPRRSYTYDSALSEVSKERVVPTGRPKAEGLDPRTKIGLVACVGTLAITLEHPTSLAVMTLITLLPFLTTKARFRRALIASAAIVWSTVLAQGLFYPVEPRTALVSLGPLTIWREGVSYGLVQSLRVISVGLAGVALAITTPLDRLNSALLRLRLPFGLALMASTAFRFIPAIAEAWNVVRSARARRGRPIFQRTPWSWLKLEISLMRPIVARALRRAWSVAESLDARGFDPTAARAVMRPLRMKQWEKWLLMGAFSITLTALSARVLFELYAADSLYVPALRGLYGAVRGWL